MHSSPTLSVHRVWHGSRAGKLTLDAVSWLPRINLISGHRQMLLPFLPEASPIGPSMAATSFLPPRGLMISDCLINGGFSVKDSHSCLKPERHVRKAEGRQQRE